MKRTPLLMDARMVGPRRHGIARYVVSLARALKETVPDWRPTLLLSGNAPTYMREEFTHVISPVPFLHPSEVLALPSLAQQAGAKLFHCTSFSTSPLFTVPFLVTLHDTIHLERPRDYGWRQSFYYRSVVMPASRRATSVITVSEASRTELIRRMHLDAMKVHAIHNGVDALFLDAPPLPREPLVFTVCGPKPHKNTQVLIHALRHAPSLRLEIAGEPSAALNAVARGIGVLDRITWLGPVEDDVLRDRYSRAAVFAFPSIVEGFGLPPLEAMACGCPAVVSDIPVMREVAGEYARFVPPLDAVAWASALVDLMNDEELRTQMSASGRDHARRFTWERTAVATAHLYEGAVAAPVRPSRLRA